jgi:hypothetical protein
MDKFFAGCVAGIVFFMVLLATLPGSLVRQANEAVQECEKSLPRDQHCKIIALPIDKE